MIGCRYTQCTKRVPCLCSSCAKAHVVEGEFRCTSVISPTFSRTCPPMEACGGYLKQIAANHISRKEEVR